VEESAYLRLLVGYWGVKVIDSDRRWGVGCWLL
jgi:hypothetical protein